MSDIADMSKMFDDVLHVANSASQQGVFAKTNIAKGTVIKNDGFVWIVQEPPKKSSGTLDSDTERQNSYAEQWAAICKDFNSPTRNLRAMIQELIPKKTHKEKQGQWLEKVLRTNGWQHFNTTKKGKRAELTMLLIYKGSKYNHSCDPLLTTILANVSIPKLVMKNSNFASTSFDKQFWVTTLVDIKKGQEVTLSYLGEQDLDAPYPQRKHLLKESWGFDCACRLCKNGATRCAPQVAVRASAVGESDACKRKRKDDMVHTINQQFLSIGAASNNRSTEVDDGQQKMQRVAQVSKYLLPPYVTLPPQLNNSALSVRMEPRVVAVVQTPALPTSGVKKTIGKTTHKKATGMRVARQEINSPEPKSTNAAKQTLQDTPQQSAQHTPQQTQLQTQQPSARQEQKRPQQAPAQQHESERDIQERMRRSKMNTLSLLRRIETLDEKNAYEDIINTQIQLGADGKLLWVERHATPQGWMVMLSPIALASCRKRIAKLIGKIENPQIVLSEEMYWQAYHMRFKQSLEKRKLTWSHEERTSCTAEQNVYEYRLTMTLLQDESVRVRVLAKPPAAPEGMLARTDHTLTFFQKRILRMTTWVEGIVDGHITRKTAPLSTVGVVCLLYRLVQYTHELTTLPSWTQTDMVLARIRACVHALYSILCTCFERVVGGSLSMTAMDLQDPVEMVDTLLFKKPYTKLVVMEFSWHLFAYNEIPRAADYLIHTAMHNVLWWRTDLQMYLGKYSHAMICNTQSDDNNYCLLRLLLESVRADEKITLHDVV